MNPEVLSVNSEVISLNFRVTSVNCQEVVQSVTAVHIEICGLLFSEYLQ